MSYLIRRVFTTQPGVAVRVASLVSRQTKAYERAGQRSPGTVYFNAKTVPGEQHRVYLEWQAEQIQSPYREGNAIPQEVIDIAGQLGDLLVDDYVEFFELLTPDKQQD